MLTVLYYLMVAIITVLIAIGVAFIGGYIIDSILSYILDGE